jgi:hypothetical protein
VTSLVLSRGYDLGWPIVSGVFGRPYVADLWHDAEVSDDQVAFWYPPFNGSVHEPESDPPITEGPVSWNSFTLRLGCWELMGDHDCGPYRARLTVPRATIGLTDDSAPAATVAGGSLVGGGVVRGVGSVVFHASDVGAGVYRSIVAVDGRELGREVVDDAGGSCADVEPGNDDAYEFGSPRPCPLDVSGEAKLDTAGLRDGTHALRVSAEDAAGNVDVVYDGTIVTHNAPIATAAPALAGAPRVGERLTVDAGSWEGAPTAFVTRWLRCDANGANCTAVAGAAGAAYVLTAADAYHRVLAEVTAENASGAASARSEASSVVADAAGSLSPPGAGAGAGIGGIAGLANPLAATGGHAPNGAAADAHAHLSLAFRLAQGGSSQRVRSVRTHAWTLAGRLLAGDGRPIAGARLAVAWQVVGHGWVAHGSARTGADGGFAYRLPTGPARAVKLVYFPFADSRVFVGSNVVHEDVVAPLELHAAPRSIRAGGVVGIGGRVRGGPVPRSGLLVTLQGWQAGWGWRTFRTVRTDRHGVWRTRYRFRLGHGRFGFRAVVSQQGDFPYVGSTSAAVFVRVA